MNATPPLGDPVRPVCADPRFRAFVPGNALLQVLFDGGAWLEGPAWFADHGTLVFSDIPNDRVLRWSESGGVSVHRQPAHFANGHARDLEGRLVECSHGLRALLRVEHDGRVCTLADRHRGKPLNAPNDVVVRRDGTVWFTDPPYGIETDHEGSRATPELPPSVYRFDPRDGSLACMADDFEGPNGLAFSPDGRRLYVSESGRQFDAEPKRCIRVFGVEGEGARLSGGQVFHAVQPGYADGMRCDAEGHLWTGAADGVHCIHPSGTLLGTVPTPWPVSNLAFGGRHLARLFLCAGQRLLTVPVNRRGDSLWP